MINPMDLSGKVILVTGASSGLGRQTCITLSRLGAKVVFLARREEKLKETLLMMENISNHAYESFDLTQIEEIATLIKELVQVHGKFDGFVHCAGIGDVVPLAATSYSFFENMMKINFYSFVEIVRIITHKKNFNQGGSIVAVSSAGSKKADKGKIGYSTSKGALDSVVRPMAIELGESKKIRVNTVNPGWIKTDMYDQYIEMFGEEKMQEIVNEHILGVAQPEDVSNLIAFLLSDATSKITGQSIVVDSGWTIW